MGVEVIEWRSSTRGSQYMCKFKCSMCGIVVEAYESNVKSGKSTRCVNCRSRLAGNANITHDKSKHKLYAKYHDILRRCYNKKRIDYDRYGGKGVTVCQEWIDSYESFYKWSIENGYKEGLCLDKDIGCDELGIYPKIYSPETCRWITISENSIYSNKNRRRINAPDSK